MFSIYMITEDKEASFPLTYHNEQVARLIAGSINIDGTDHGIERVELFNDDTMTMVMACTRKGIINFS